MDTKYFQVRTNKKIDSSNEIRWMLLLDEQVWFTVTEHFVYSKDCEKYTLTGDEGFLSKAGVMTFLKTSTELKVWFDGEMNVTWLFEDTLSGFCMMKKKMTGLRFRTDNYLDQVSVQYRYQTGWFI